MRPFTRLPFREALYVCSNCRQCALPRVTSRIVPQFRGYASSDPPSFLERTRRNLWKGDKPPGQEDPYTGPSQLAPEATEKEQTEGTLASGESGAAAEELAVGDEYEQASTWDGLESIGYTEEKAWVHNGPNEETDEYVRFGADIQAHYDTVTAASHQAIVEICLMSMLGKSPSSILQDNHAPEIQRIIQECTVDSSRGWQNALQFSSEQSMNELVSAFRNIDGSSDLKIENPERYLQPPMGPQEGLSLANQELKFFYVKRITQLSGQRLPDPVINSSTTVDEFISLLAAKSKPESPNVSEELAKHQTQGTLPPNLRFTDNLVTRGDHDEDYGRKKAIHSEFYERGLLFTKDGKPVRPRS